MRRTVNYVLYVLFTASVFVLVVKLLVPTKVYLVITGNEVRVFEVHGLYTLGDVLIIALAASVASITGTLVIIGFGGGNRSKELISISGKYVGVSNDVIRYWEMVKNELGGIEAKVIEELLRAGGSMYQRDLQQVLNIPKSTLSTVLTKLEARGAVIRVKRGLRNLIILTKPKEEVNH